jgi:hypothetical protein
MKTFLNSAKVVFLLILLNLGFIPNDSIAQTDFKLSDYQNPDYHLRTLDIDFDLYGNNTFNKSSIQEGTMNKNSSNLFNTNINALYSSWKNNRNYQGKQSYQLQISSYWYKNESENDANGLVHYSGKSNQQGIQLGVNSENRFYNDKNHFFELDVDLSGFTGSNRRKVSEDRPSYPFNNESSFTNSSIFASVPLLIGTGRIEAVQDARLALYILDDLTKSGDLKKAPNKDEVLALARFITETKNKRYFDSRLRKIAEITAIDSFLIAKDLKSQSDASYYTLLNDNWDFAQGPVRESGSRFSLGLIPAFNHFKSIEKLHYQDTVYLLGTNEMELTNKSDNLGNDLGLDFVAAYKLEKPTNLYWQHSTNIQAGYSLLKSQNDYSTFLNDSVTSDDSYFYHKPNLQMQIGHDIGYYPTSRTSIILGLDASYQQYWNRESKNDETEVKTRISSLEGGLNLNCSYYFSPQLRLSVFVNSWYNYDYSNQDGVAQTSTITKDNKFQAVYSARLTYSLF